MNAELAAHQRLSDAVEEAYRFFLSPPEGRVSGPETFHGATEMFVALGDDVLPFLENELSLERANRDLLAIYALGHMRSEGAEKLLRDKLDELNGREGKKARRFKMWVCYALAIQGHPDAAVLTLTGGVNAAKGQVLPGMPVIDTAAALAAPGSEQPLLQRLHGILREGPGEDEKDFVVNTSLLLDALGHVKSPSLIPLFLELSGDEREVIRFRALKALARFDRPETVDRILEALETETHSLIRQTAAKAIETFMPDGRTDRIKALLEKADDPFVRGCLYRVLARPGDDAAVESLIGYWGRSEPQDRVYLLHALGKTGSTRPLNLIRSALSDEEQEVAQAATLTLAVIGTPGAIDTLLELIDDRRWAVVSAAMEHLVAIGERRTGPRIAERLFSKDLPVKAPVEDRRIPVMKMCEALVSLQYSEAADRIEEWLANEWDTELRNFLPGVVARLRTAAAKKNSVKAWSRALSSTDVEIRHMAFDAIARLGGRKAGAALLEAFKGAGRNDRIAVLRAVGRYRMQEASAILEAVLMGEAFDAFHIRGIRATAAWAAARIGTPAMADLLRRSAERRKGRDFAVLEGLASIGGAEAIPVLQATHVRALSYFGPKRYEHFNATTDLLLLLADGRTPEVPEKPPVIASPH